MSISGTMDWEWFTTWDNAINEYIPLYSKNNIVKSFFAVNVPYPIPIFAF